MRKTLPAVAVCALALLVIAQDRADDEPGDLRMEMDEIGTEDELLERLAEHYGDGVEVMITPELKRVLEAREAGDDDALRKVLSEIVGQEVTLPHEQTRFESPRHKVWERRTTDEILSLMRPEHVEALAGLRHLLDDEQRLFLELDDLTGLEREAGMAFIARLSKREPIESMMPPELLEERRLSRERGWYDLPGPAMGSQLLREMELLDDRATAQLRRTSLRLAPEDERTVGGDASGWSFDHSAYERLEVHPETEFGAVLSVEKSPADAVHYDDPNLVIAGRDAAVSVGRHSDGVWVTKVSAFDGRHVYHIVLEKRLDEGAERDAFVRMATRLIENDSREN